MTKQLLTILGFSAFAVAVTALAALSRLLEQLAAAGSPTFSLTSLIVPRLKFLDPEPLARILNVWLSATNKDDLVAAILRWHVGLDVVVIAGVLVLLLRSESLVARWFTAVYFVSDVIENVCLLSVAGGLAEPFDAPALLRILGGATFFKWLALGVAVASAIWNQRFREWWRHTRSAIAAVRAPITVAAILTAMMLLPGGGPLEQLPDIVRAQVLSDNGGWRIVRQPFILPALMIVLLGVTAWLAARRTARSVQVFRTSQRGSQSAMTLGKAVAIAIIITCIAGAVWFFADPSWYIATAGSFSPLIFCALAAVALIRTPLKADPLPRPTWASLSTRAAFVLTGKPPTADRLWPDQSAVGERIGVICGALIAALPGLAIVRSLTDMVIVAGYLHSAGDFGKLLTALGWGIGWSFVLPVAFVLVARKFANAHRRSPAGAATEAAPTGPDASSMIGRVKVWLRKLDGLTRLLALIFLGSAVVAILIAWRTALALPLGPQGVVCLAFLLFLPAAALIDTWPRAYAVGPITKSLGFSRRPIGALLLLTFIMAGTLNETVAYHAVVPLKEQLSVHSPTPNIGATGSQSEGTQGEANTGETPRDGWDEELATWTERVQSCLQGEQLTAKELPLILVATQGGGIRAAYWTVKGLDAITAGPCRRQMIFAISGASGGSVGATVWVGAGDRPADIDAGMWKSAADQISSLSATNAITENLAALLFRDFPVGFTGIHPRFRDRARIMEAAWEKEAPALNRRFDTIRDSQGHDWWPHLLLNASDVSRACRILITTLPLAMTTGAPKDPLNPQDCNRRTARHGRDAFALGTLDARLLTVGKEPCKEGEDAPPTAMWAIRASTAAHLSARFFYVSPSGGFVVCHPARVAGGKPVTHRVQVVDGGYRDNTGLSTLVEMWRPLGQAVERHNQKAGSGPKIRPMIVEVDNHYRSGSVADSPRRLGELAVPIRGAGASHHLASEAVLEQAAAAIMEKAWPESVPGSSANTSHDQKSTCTGFIVIAPKVAPGLAAPLGWALSKQSQQALDSQLQDSKSGAPLVQECVGKFVFPRQSGESR
jgi:hypothetical protein